MSSQLAGDVAVWKRGMQRLVPQVPEAAAALGILAMHEAAKCQPRPAVGTSTVQPRLLHTEGPVSAQGSLAATSVATGY